MQRLATGGVRVLAGIVVVIRASWGTELGPDEDVTETPNSATTNANGMTKSRRIVRILTTLNLEVQPLTLQLPDMDS
jgi:hypothetical protein